MDNAIINNHNSLIKKDDDVYIVGDFSMYTTKHKSTLEQYVRKLNGNLHLIMGNHDIKNPIFYMEIGFKSFHFPYLEIEKYILCHDPALSNMNQNRKFLCGHVHNLFKTCKSVINVGVDVNNFKPVSMIDIYGMES